MASSSYSVFRSSISSESSPEAFMATEGTGGASSSSASGSAPSDSGGAPSGSGSGSLEAPTSSSSSPPASAGVSTPPSKTPVPSYDVIPLTFSNPGELAPSVWRAHVELGGRPAVPSSEDPTRSKVNLRVRKGVTRESVFGTPRNLNAELNARVEASPAVSGQPLAGAGASSSTSGVPAASATTTTSASSALSASQLNSLAAGSPPSSSAVGDVAQAIASSSVPVGPPPVLQAPPRPPEVLPALQQIQDAQTAELLRLKRAYDDLRAKVTDQEAAQKRLGDQKNFLEKRLSQELARNDPSNQLGVERQVQQVLQRTIPTSPVDAQRQALVASSSASTERVNSDSSGSSSGGASSSQTPPQLDRVDSSPTSAFGAGSALVKIFDLEAKRLNAKSGLPTGDSESPQRSPQRRAEIAAGKKEEAPPSSSMQAGAASDAQRVSASTSAAPPLSPPAAAPSPSPVAAPAVTPVEGVDFQIFMVQLHNLNDLTRDEWNVHFGLGGVSPLRVPDGGMIFPLRRDSRPRASSTSAPTSSAIPTSSVDLAAAFKAGVSVSDDGNAGTNGFPPNGGGPPGGGPPGGGPPGGGPPGGGPPGGGPPGGGPPGGGWPGGGGPPGGGPPDGGPDGFGDGHPLPFGFGGPAFVPTSFGAQNSLRFQHVPGGQPFSLLADFDKKSCVKNHEKAIFWLEREAPEHIRFFTGIPNPTAPVEGFDALMFMTTMNKVITLFRSYHPQEICYVSDELMLRYLVPPSLRESAEFALEESPASLWYAELNPAYKTSLPVFWSHFCSRWLDANLLTDYFIVEFERIRLSDFLDRRTHVYDSPQYLIQVDQIDTYLYYLTGTRLDGSTKYRIARYHHFLSATTLWDKLWERGQRDWTSLVAQLQDYHTQQIYRPGVQSQPGSFPSDRSRRSGSGFNPTASSTPYGFSSRQRNARYGSSRDSDFSNRYHALQESSDADSDSRNESDVQTCTFCALDMDASDDFCGCEFSTEFIDGHSSEPVAAFSQIAEALFAVADRGPDSRVDPKLSTCCICGRQGHFGRDCREIGGSGNSVRGARYGTAPGFKKGDDPGLRDKRYVKWVTERRAAFSQARSQSARSMPRGGAGKGKMKTHARRLKTGKATNPPESHYQMIRRFNLLLSDLDDELSQAADIEGYNALISVLNEDSEQE